MYLYVDTRISGAADKTGLRDYRLYGRRWRRIDLERDTGSQSRFADDSKCPGLLPPGLVRSIRLSRQS